ncbi:GNAT family N-acetyltransferase [Aurantiacibacter poecillastricola]|uniref:GNAT family N-acetyltransferase n=1 Tax=Aurantiacibacter poecillastricola TaxID=3064385 RepID=UPI00273FF2CF|nr:GNAT family protein [Aurantiacibacter sp. 219JJ12-13]MDP5261591.1 GNAT family protein [Aurantiacibacter sp. 219JJ12-13]
MSNGPALTTKRFLCRAPTDADVDAFLPAFGDSAHMRYWSRGPFATREELADYLLDEKAGRSWVAEPSEGGAPVFRMFTSQNGPQVNEIGYIIVPGNEGRGIARECLSALFTHLFREEGVHRIFADVDPRNTRSNALLEKLGFTMEGHLRHTMKTHIGWCDSYIWGLLADEWRV